MSKVLKIAGEVIVGAALVVATAGAGAALIGGWSIGAAIGIGGAALGAAAGAIGLSVGAVLAIGAGLTLAGGLLAKKPQVSPSQIDRTKVSLVLDAPRTIVFGHTALGTDLRYQEFWGSEQEYVSQILLVASHWCESIDQVWLNDTLGWDAANGTRNGIGQYNGYFFVSTRPQAAPGNPYHDDWSNRWGDNACFTGCATIYFVYRVIGTDNKAGGPFSSSIPTRVTIRGKGARVYDPRLDSTAGGSGTQRSTDQSTWAFAPSGVENGRNPALCLLFYLLGWRIQNPVTGVWKLAVGLGIPVDRIDLSTFITAANLCDESVNLAAGGTEPRYRCDGMFSEADDPGTVITSFEASMNGKLRDSGGLFSLQVFHNDLATPVLDFTDDDVLDDFTWDAGAALNDLKNVIRGRYTNPSDASLYQLVDYPPVSLPSLDGIDRIDTFDLALVQSPSQAQRLAKARLERYQYPGTFAANFKARAWAVKDGDVVRQTFSPLGFSTKIMRVTKSTVDVTGVVSVIMAEENAAIYLWDNDESPAVVAAAPNTFDPIQQPIKLAIDDAAETANWSGVADNDPENHPRPEDGADVTATALPAAYQSFTGRDAKAVVEDLSSAIDSIASETIRAATWRGESDNVLYMADGTPVRTVVQALGVTVDGHTAYIAFLQQVNGDGSAKATFTVNADGHIVGWEALAEGSSGNNQLSFVASKYLFVDDSGQNPINALTYQDGVWQMKSVVVDTLKVGTQFSVAGVINFGTGTSHDGSGSAPSTTLISVASYTLTLPKPATVLILLAGTQNYYGAAGDYGVGVQVNGGGFYCGSSAGASVYVSSFAGIGAAPLPAGVHTFDILWRGSTGTRLNEADVILMAVF